MRDIAERAGVSTGSVYHHFRDKEAIFQTLLDHFRAATGQPDFPLLRVFEDGAFPDNLAAVGAAAQETVARWRPYIALIYVDVVEFEGAHIHRFYSDMATLFEQFLIRRQDLDIPSRVRDGIPPAAAMMLTARIFIYYFVVELLFGVPNHFGMSREDATRIIADVLSGGIARRVAPPGLRGQDGRSRCSARSSCSSV